MTTLAQPRTAAETAQERREEREHRAWRSHQQDVAEKAVWRWTMARGSSTIWVYRDDVVLDDQPPEGDLDSTGSLTAHALERALLSSPASFVRWESASVRATAAEASTARRPGSFDNWWKSATAHRWLSASEIPGHAGPRTGTSSGGGHGIGSSDYGGGHYGGDSGGGHSSGGGFGTSF